MPEPTPSSPPTPFASSTRAAAGGSKRILVLGEDAAVVQAVDRFMAVLGLEPVVICGGNGGGGGSGSSIVERLEGGADAGFAVIVLGATGAAPSSADARPPGWDPMALALGFCLATLGRRRICVMHPPGGAMPAALEGLTRQPIDESGLWRLLLAREMRQAGLDVDLNRAV